MFRNSGVCASLITENRRNRATAVRLEAHVQGRDARMTQQSEADDSGDDAAQSVAITGAHTHRQDTYQAACRGTTPSGLFVIITDDLPKLRRKRDRAVR